MADPLYIGIEGRLGEAERVIFTMGAERWRWTCEPPVDTDELCDALAREIITSSADRVVMEAAGPAFIILDRVRVLLSERYGRPHLHMDAMQLVLRQRTFPGHDRGSVVQ